MKQVKLILIIYFTEPNIATIVSFQPVVDIKNINDRFYIPIFILNIQSLAIVSHSQHISIGTNHISWACQPCVLVAAMEDCTNWEETSWERNRTSSARKRNKKGVVLAGRQKSPKGSWFREQTSELSGWAHPRREGVESTCEASSGEFVGLGVQGLYCLVGVRWLQFQSEIYGDREAVVV